MTYADGTKATLDQEAHDVVTFLAWAANPEMEERKRIGVRVMLFLAMLTGITYAVKRKVWSDVHLPRASRRLGGKREALRCGGMAATRTMTQPVYRHHRRLRPLRHRRAGGQAVAARRTRRGATPSDELLFGRLDGVRCVFLPRHGRGHRLSPTHLNYRANIDALKRCRRAPT